MGAEVPRIFTSPARKLTRKASLGFEAIWFAENILGITLFPWQKWWLIHALELDSNGDFRFRVIITLVGRQNGKTTLLTILALYFMYRGRARLVLGSAQSLDIARESWQSAVDLAEGEPELAAEIERVRNVNGQQTLTLLSGARYKIAASTRKAGRGLSVDLLILDELREHRDWLAWAALSKTTTARPCALTVAISNAGDDYSVVLNALRDQAIAGMDETIAIFEWSALDGCDLDDRQAWAMSNPALGHPNGISVQAIETARATDPPSVFRTETLCQRVSSLDGAIDLVAWHNSKDAAGTLDSARDRVVACLDVAPDGAHATLVAAAALPNGMVRVEVVAAWSSTEQARAELLGTLDEVRPAAVAWFPGGPAAAIAPLFRRINFWEPSGPVRAEHTIVEITGARVPEVCQSFVDLVTARRVVHPDDPLLNAHIAGATKLNQGDGWRFARRDVGHVDAVYAAAGAVHTALTLPIERPMPRSQVF